VELIQELMGTIEQLEKENALLKEQNTFLMKKICGQKSESSVSVGLPTDEKALCLEESSSPADV